MGDYLRMLSHPPNLFSHANGKVRDEVAATEKTCANGVDALGHRIECLVM
jgi:hypothetical protein